MTREESIIAAVKDFTNEYPTCEITQITIKENLKSYTFRIGYYDQDNYEHNSRVLKGYKK